MNISPPLIKHCTETYIILYLQSYVSMQHIHVLKLKTVQIIKKNVFLLTFNETLDLNLEICTGEGRP